MTLLLSSLIMLSMLLIFICNSRFFFSSSSSSSFSCSCFDFFRFLYSSQALLFFLLISRYSWFVCNDGEGDERDEDVALGETKCDGLTLASLLSGETWTFG